MPGMMSRPRLALSAVLLLALAACAPALDWREVRPGAGRVLVWMPCKPDRVERSVPLPGGAPRPMQMLVCTAGGSTWAVSSVALDDPARVGPVLDGLRRLRAENLGGVEAASAPYAPAGASPQPAARRFQLRGQRPDGRPVAEESAVFALGLHVYHLAVLDGSPSAESREMFFERLQISRP